MEVTTKETGDVTGRPWCLFRVYEFYCPERGVTVRLKAKNGRQYKNPNSKWIVDGKEFGHLLEAGRHFDGENQPVSETLLELAGFFL